MPSDHLQDVTNVIKQKEVSLPLGVVLERRKSTHPWGDWIWKPIAVLPGARPINQWQIVGEGSDWTHYHAATIDLVLHRKETEALKLNIEDQAPHLFVILRDNEDDNGGEAPFLVHQVTASSYDAQDYLDTAEELIEKVPMPDIVFQWIKAFVDEHHVEEKFIKRQRDKVKTNDHKFGKEPIFTSPPRRPRHES